MTTHTTALLPDLTQQIEANRAAAKFTNYAICIAKGLERSAYPESFQRGVIEAMSTSNTSALQAESMAFVNLLNTRTVLGRMQNFTIPAPPFTTIATITDDPDAPWVGELAPVPLVQLTTSAAVRTDATKFQIVIAVVQEWLRSADPKARGMIERRMVRALRLAEDRHVLSDVAAVAHERAAGLLHGVTETPGGSPASLTMDLESLWSSVRSGEPDAPFFTTSKRGATYLASLRVDGAPRFPHVGPNGGTLLGPSGAGVPVLTSRAAGAKLILVDATQVAVADSGIVVDESRYATAQMSDTPVDAPASLVSAWQSDCVFLKFTRHLNWVVAVDDAVGFLTLDIAGSPA